MFNLSDHAECAVPCPKCGAQMRWEGTGKWGSESNWQCTDKMWGKCDTLIPWNGEEPPAEYPSQKQAQENSLEGKVTCKMCAAPRMQIRAGKRFWENEYECTLCGMMHVINKDGYLAKKSFDSTTNNTSSSDENPFFDLFKEELASSNTSSPVSSSAPASGVMRHPSVVTYTCKEFTGTTENVPGKGQVYYPAEYNLQNYLNINRIDPNKIISISMGAYGSSYGGLVRITLVHY